MSKKSKGRQSIRSRAAVKGWATRRANILRAKRSAAARKGHATRKANARKIKPRGAPQGTGENAERAAPARDTGGFQDGGIYGGHAVQEEPEYIDFDGWDFEDFEGLDSEADDDGDTGGESAKT